MFEIKNVEIITEELKIKNNNLLGDEYLLNPQIARKVGVESELDSQYFTMLKVKIKSTDESAFPVDVKVVMKAIFTLDINDKCEDKHIQRFLRQQGVHILYPYVRSSVASLSSVAMIPTIMLPVINALNLFKEDKEWIDENFNNE